MTEKSFEIKYREYSSASEMDAQDRELVEAAISALDGSYAPYSEFHVGAAVRLANGLIIKGANQENAASPSGLCAERTAMFAASANYPGVAMKSIAIAGKYHERLTETITSPCGACRQVMAEYQKLAGEPMSVILYSTTKIMKFQRVDDILPLIFDNLDK